MEKLNWKFIVITALAAVFISILSGLVGGVSVGSILVRAFVVLLVFAFFSAALNFVAVTFLQNENGTENPESPENITPESGGSKVNIVLTEDDEVAELQAEPEGDESTGMATGTVESTSKTNGLGERSRQVDMEMATSMDVDTLPDLGSFSSTFSSQAENEEKKTEPEAESGYNEGTSFSSGGRLSPQGIAGTIAEQNSPEDIAKAVKTVMNREEKR